MAIDPKKWTTRTQEAVAAAGESARTNGNPEVTPDHVMVALLDQPDTVIPPTLKILGIAPACCATAPSTLSRSCRACRAAVSRE